MAIDNPTRFVSLADAGAPAPVPAPPANGVDRLANKDIFMQLLVAQLKNQNPLNPSDGVEFMSQLTSFSQLEQLVDVRSELKSIHQDLTAALGNNATQP